MTAAAASRLAYVADVLLLLAGHFTTCPACVACVQTCPLVPVPTCCVHALPLLSGLALFAGVSRVGRVVGGARPVSWETYC